jgi:hypothetical protein
MRAIFFRDHEISGLRPAAAPSRVGRPGRPGQDLSTSNPVGRDRPALCPIYPDSVVTFAPYVVRGLAV